MLVVTNSFKIFRNLIGTIALFRTHLVFVHAALSLCLTADLARAIVVSFEGTSDVFPESQGWERSTFCTPERSFQDGWFVQVVEIDECGPPPGGDRDAYLRDIPELEKESNAFFLEARLHTTGPGTEIIGQAPAAITASSFGAVCYTLTIADDQVKLFRDALLPVLFFDLDPTVPHTFRLETFGADLYIWYIDGVVVDSGIPEGPYPSAFPFAGWLASVFETNSTTRLRYLRFGGIPVDASGDFNSDGQIDDNDAPFFAECMLGPGIDAGPGCRWADFDADTDVDCADRDAFTAAWTGANNPPPLTACLGPTAPIPALSQWGVAVTTLLLLIAGSSVFRHRLSVVPHR